MECIKLLQTIEDADCFDGNIIARLQNKIYNTILKLETIEAK